MKTLQGQAFHLSEKSYAFLSSKYDNLTTRRIPGIVFKNTHPEAVKQIISLHRSQFITEEYIESRINNPVTGTLDHLHAEITSMYAVLLGKAENLDKHSLELLRAAGHLHDIDRSFPKKMIRGEEKVKHDPEGYRNFKKRHAENSVKLTEELVERVRDTDYAFSEELLDKLRYLILRHEWGGEKLHGKIITNLSGYTEGKNLNQLADIVKNADSLAYFDANILTNWEEWGKDKQALTYKVHFMFDRMDNSARRMLKDTILFSSEHILGTAEHSDSDISEIRKVLISICV